MHLKRWITGVVALPLIYYLVAGGGIVFSVFIAAVSILTLWEYFNIVLSTDKTPAHQLICIVAYLISFIFILSGHYGLSVSFGGILSVNLLLTGMLSLPIFKKDTKIPFVIVKQSFGLVYISLFLSYLVLIRNDGGEGAAWIFLILLIIAAGDTGAFYVGSYFGRHKLCPWVSPKKTIEGSVGGLMSNIIIAIIFKTILLPSLPTLQCIIFAVLIGIAGQAGDLFESEFKRAAGVKDSSNLLPGHGGFLDRIDALLFASPVAYFLKSTIF